MTWQPMSTAPRDGTEIIIRTWFGNVRAYYVDCSDLREPFEYAPGRTLEGVPEIKDAWRPTHRHVTDDDIELSDALGWRAVEDSD